MHVLVAKKFCMVYPGGDTHNMNSKMPLNDDIHGPYLMVERSGLFE